MSTINDLFYQTHEMWVTDGPPKSAFQEAGPFFLLVDKDPSWIGDANGKYPIRAKLDGNVGPAYTKVFANASGASGVQFLQPISQNWGLVKVRSKFLALLKNPSALESGMEGLMDDMEQALKAWQRSMSYLFWLDGRGGLAVGDAAYSVAGNQIIFLNTKCTKFFEVGDVIRLIARATFDAAAPGTQPAARAGTLTVTKVLSNGLQCSANINTVAGAVNTDVISKDVYYAGAGDTDLGTGVVMPGVFTWLAQNNTLANTTLYGVDRSVRPERLAGRRVTLTGTESPWTICSRIMAEAVDSGAGITSIFVPTSEIDDLMEEMASRNIHYRDVTMGEDKPQNMKIGVDAIQVVTPGIKCTIKADPFLVDPFVTASNDKQYVGLKLDDWKLTTTVDGCSWKDYDGDGTYLKTAAGTQDYEAAYGCFGALGCEDTGHQIVARVGADA